MKSQRQKEYLEKTFRNYPELESLRVPVCDAAKLLVRCYRADGQVMTYGNGGSAADSEHIVGELMKGFLKKRPLSAEQKARIAATGLTKKPDGFELALQQGLRAISLVSQSSLLTAFSNDVDPDMVFAQQVFTYGRLGDVLIALSTSGNSKNVVNAAIAARAAGVKIIAFTGERESDLSRISEITLRVPSAETHRIQEYHLPLYHVLCALVEEVFFGELEMQNEKTIGN